MLTDRTTSPTEARKNFFRLLEQVAQDHEIITIDRRDGENVVIIAESDLAGLMEMAYLLKSPANATRLLEALERSKARDAEAIVLQETTDVIAQLKQELGFGKEEA